MIGDKDLHARADQIKTLAADYDRQWIMFGNKHPDWEAACKIESNQRAKLQRAFIRQHDEAAGVIGDLHTKITKLEGDVEYWKDMYGSIVDNDGRM